MNIAVSSDWHGNLPSKTDRGEISECDLLLLAGDIFSHRTNYTYGVLDPVGKFIKELTNKGIQVIMTPGNHDFSIYNAWLDQNPKSAKWISQHTVPRMNIGGEKLSIDLLQELLGITVLIDSHVEVNGLKIYGTPWTPEFYRWAFMLEEDYLHEVYDRIPTGLDILLSHGPPRFGQIDCILQDPEDPPARCGSTSLTNCILDKKPKYVFCGHIHSGSHEWTNIGQSDCRNVSLLNEDYRVNYSPYYFDSFRCDLV